MAKKILIIDALKVQYNDVHYYITVIQSKKLFSVSEVSRADENPEEGYQRLLGKSRATRIAEYLREGNVIPGALVLSAQNGAIKKYDRITKKLHISTEPGGFLVIDGQHRLYGASQYEKDIPMPVCIFDKLEKAQEVKYFLDVNGTQRGVPRTLQLELTKFNAEPDSKEDMLVRLFREMNDAPSSPLSGRLSATKSVTGKLSHVPFQSGIGTVWDKPPMNTLDYDKKKKLLLNYLSAMEDVLVEEYGNSQKLTNAAFFQALMLAFVDAASTTMSRFNDYKKNSFRAVLSSVPDIDFDGFPGTNKKVINLMADAIKGEVNRSLNLSDDKF